MREAVATSESAAPRGQYSQGIVADGKYLMVAGQLPIDPATGQIVDGSFEAQAAAALQNLAAVVRAAGADLAATVRVTVYLKDVGNSAKLTELYRATFGEPFPAWTTVGAQLPFGAEIKIDAMVVLDR